MAVIYNSSPAMVEVVDNSQKVVYENDVSVNTIQDTKQLLDNGVVQLVKSNTTATINEKKLQKLANDVYTKAIAIGTL